MKFFHLIRRAELPMKCNGQSTWRQVNTLCAVGEQVSVKTIHSSWKTLIGRNIVVKGWIQSTRKMKGLNFVNLSDGTTPKPLQVVISKEMAKRQRLTFRTAASFCGHLVLSPGTDQDIELSVEQIEVIKTCSPDEYPFQNKSHKFPLYRHNSHLRMQVNWCASIVRLRDCAMQLIREFYSDRDYFQVHPPVLTSVDCEGAGEVFSCSSPSNDFFPTPVYLTVSSQLHLESYVQGLGRVYCIGPVFRAERSMTSFHLSEFYMIEVETAFCSDIGRAITEVVNLLKFLAKEMLARNALDVETVVKFTDRSHMLETILETDPVVVTYDMAIHELQCMNVNAETTIRYGDELTKEQEIQLVHHFNDRLTFVTHFPSEQKPFYMALEGDKAVCFDLLVPNLGELSGGSVREHDTDKLNLRLPSDSKDLYRWYLELREFGGAPTLGYGVGFDRLIQFLLGLPNIRDVVGFPRHVGQCQM